MGPRVQRQRRRGSGPRRTRILRAGNDRRHRVLVQKWPAVETLEGVRPGAADWLVTAHLPAAPGLPPSLLWLTPTGVLAVTSSASCSTTPLARSRKNYSSTRHDRRIRTRRRGYLLGSTHPKDWRLFLVQLWAGIDAGKAHHHCFVIDSEGNRLLSQRISNDEPDLLQLLATVLELAAGDEVVWATDLNHGGPALLIALLVGHGQNILYIPGRTVYHASKLYRGDGTALSLARVKALWSVLRRQRARQPRSLLRKAGSRDKRRGSRFRPAR